MSRADEEGAYDDPRDLPPRDVIQALQPPPQPDPVAVAYQRRLSPSDPEAMVILADLAEQFFAARSTQAPDPHATSFFNGQRAVFLYIAGRVGLPLIAR